MTYRYRKTQSLYIPQYRVTEAEPWKDLLVKHLTSKTIKGFAEVLANYASPTEGWNSTPYHFNPRKDEKVEDVAIVFDKEWAVMAFLGAYKSFYDIETKEFSM